MKPVILVVANLEELSRAAATEFVRQVQEAVQAKGAFTVALSGGSTPKNLYALLADDTALRTTIPWDKVHFFWGDERHVPPDHPDSNYRMAHEALLDRVAVASVHRMHGEERQAAAAAAGYEAELRRFFGLASAGDPPPRLDLMLLGVGPDGHTASLFPGSSALDER